MPSYLYAVLSALLWALSAVILNKGLQQIPARYRSICLLTGLVAAQLVGTLILGLLLLAYGNQPLTVSGNIVAAGIFTFPIATGFYYLSGHAFGKRMEFASQFAKIKPLFSVLLAILVLHETISSSSYLALFLITLGLAILILSAQRGTLPWRAIALGLATALAWSIGEMFMKLGLGTASASLGASFVALASAATLSLILLFPAVFQVLRTGILLRPWLPAFIAHGVISFALAYACFFESLRLIGLAQTVLINAFWPLLAIAFSCLQQRIEGTRCKVPVGIWLAAGLVFAGSLIQGFALHQ